MSGWPCSFSLLALRLALIWLSSCHVSQLALRASGTTLTAQVPLDLVWETELFTYSDCGVVGGCPAPYNPREVVARCLPQQRCKALVYPREKFMDMRLDVVGLTPGPAVVELRYRQPESDEWRSARLKFMFLPPAHKLPILALGERMRNGPLLLEHIGQALLAKGIKGPARCEATDGFLNRFTCFGVENFGGALRHASCQHTTRCIRQRELVPYGGFDLHVTPNFDTGRAIRIEPRIGVLGVITPVDAWEVEPEEREQP